MDEVFLYRKLSYDIGLIKEVICKSGVLAIVKPNDHVLIKPNFVQESRIQDDDWDYVITHPALISAVIELLTEILCIGAEIIIADAPMTGASFKKIMEHMPVTMWQTACKEKGIVFSIIDLRDEEWKMSDNGIILSRQRLKGDPKGKVMVDLIEKNSEFFTKPKTVQKLYGADYDIEETNRAHNGVDNWYSVSRTVIETDVIINLPKLKTHKKAGITCCLKNLVGINTNKNLLPHHTIGTPQNGGDQFADSSSGRALESRMTDIAKKITTKFRVLTPLLVPLKKIATLCFGNNQKTVRSGGWYGNDTLWRTILDLNKVMFYSTINGKLKADLLSNRKRYIGIVDAIEAGQGNGPLEPERVHAGALICGTNPVSIDCVAAKLMGYDYRKIPQLRQAFEIKNYKLINTDYSNICCIDDEKSIQIEDLSPLADCWEPSLGWKGNIELR